MQTTSVELEDRKKQYEARLAALNAKCMTCIQQTHGSVDHERCEMHCTTGFRIRSLETEYSDVTGFAHEHWRR